MRERRKEEGQAFGRTFSRGAYLTASDTVEDLGVGVPLQTHGAHQMLWAENKQKKLVNALIKVTVINYKSKVWCTFLPSLVMISSTCKLRLPLSHNTTDAGRMKVSMCVF